MASSGTEEYNTGTFRSHVNLVNPHKERGIKIKRTCNSEPFLKPKMSPSKVKFIHQILSYFKFKDPVCLREVKTIVPPDQSESESENLIFPRGNCSKGQMSITNNSIRTVLQKNKFEVSIPKQEARSKQKCDKTGGSKISKEVWENIKRPSAKVILDPNTANPTLKLSADERSVRTKTHKEFQSNKSYQEYQRKHNQYNGWTCVQAKEGYSTGRHYWEVDVKRKCDWRVGVVKESAQRSGFIKLNTTTGYWTLRLQLGSLMALTEPVTKLNQMPATKIGVHLDLEEGQVSFYDAMKKKHIYTFNAEFRACEKIYPVFGTVETDNPLKII